MTARYSTRTASQVRTDADEFAPEIHRRLLEFYDRHQSGLPWRADPDPYRVWVSEIMLQQTRVETVIPYYVRWLARFPTLKDLAEAHPEEVLRAWAGLGYYSRARNLHRAAMVVRERHRGEVPGDPAALRALPGVGEYTAGAIASIAFGRKETAVDGNARRVLSRLFDLRRPSATELRSLAARLVPRDRPGDFNQALMDLGRMVCTPRSPDCPRCPLARSCRARANGTQEARPGARPRSPVPVFCVGTAVIVSPRGRALLARRPLRGLLGGLWEFPGAVTQEDEEPRAAARRALAAAIGPPARRAQAVPGAVAPVRHAYSHRRHEYHAFRFRVAEEAARPFGGPGLSRRDQFRRREGDRAGIAAWSETAWVRPAEFNDFPLSAAQCRIAAAVAGSGGRDPRFACC